MSGAGIDDAWAVADAIRAGRRTAVDAVGESFERIAELDPDINAFTVLARDAALSRARAVDAGIIAGPLAGVPISVKDHVWVRGLAATNGSRALAGFVPDEDCVAVARLLDAGAIVVGKTNNPEFCYRAITTNGLFGTTRNPRDLTRTTGGSSGGAAASVAAGMVPLAIGTDGGGSIRIPSAFCGTAGLKPTFGLVPKLPGFRGWPTLSVTGPIAASVRDLALTLSMLAGPSPHDPLSYPAPRTDYLTGLDAPHWRGLRVAVSADLGFADVDDDVRACFADALAALADNGAELVERHPEPIDPTSLWDAIALPEGYASEGPLVAAHPDLVGVDAAGITRAGRDISAASYLDAQDRRRDFTRVWQSFFDEVDVLLTPTMPCVAFGTGRLAPATIAGRAVPESFDSWCAFALPANLAGLPAVSVPIGTGAHALPVGLQVMAPRFGDATALRAAAAIELCTRLPWRG